MFKNKKKSAQDELLYRLEKLEYRMDKLMKYQLEIVHLLRNIFIEKDLSKNINVKISKN